MASTLIVQSSGHGLQPAYELHRGDILDSQGSDALVINTDIKLTNDLSRTLGEQQEWLDRAGRQEVKFYNRRHNCLGWSLRRSFFHPIPHTRLKLALSCQGIVLHPFYV